MALIPGGFGFGSRRINAFDPFFPDPWDPLAGFTLGPSSPLLSLPRPSPLYFPSESSALVGARVDWKETPEAHVFKADLPGLKKDELKVEVEDGRILQISGERKIDKEEGTDNWHCVERRSGKFLQRFRLPENARVDQVRAAMKDGVLTVTVPKADIKKSCSKQITCQSMCHQPFCFIRNQNNCSCPKRQGSLCYRGNKEEGPTCLELMNPWNGPLPSTNQKEKKRSSFQRKRSLSSSMIPVHMPPKVELYVRHKIP